MTNPFEAFADSQRTPKARAFEQRRAEREHLSEFDKARVRMAEATPSDRRVIRSQELATRYRKWKAEQLRDLLSGPHGRNIVELRKWMRRLTINDAPALLHHIPALSWLWEISKDRRFLVRSMIAAQIVRIRQRAGLHPFDDALDHFGEPPDASTTVLAMLA